MASKINYEVRLTDPTIENQVIEGASEYAEAGSFVDFWANPSTNAARKVASIPSSKVLWIKERLVTE